MEKGWIKLHRQLKKKAFYRKPTYLSLWVHLLLSVNHEKSEFLWNGKVVIVHPGQLLTGRKHLSEETGVPETSVERILNFFQETGKIGQQKTTKYRLITILNWDQYQIVDNRRTTDGQQTDTYKEYKEYKEYTANKSPTSSMKKNSFGSYREDHHSDEAEDAVDFETGERLKSPCENQKERNAHLTTMKNKLIGDLIERQGRNRSRVNLPKMKKDLNRLIEMDIQPQEIHQKLIELENSEYWLEQKGRCGLMPDFGTVVSHFEKKL